MKLDGEIVSAEITYAKDMVFGKFDDNAKDLYSPYNSIFCTVVEHELLHTWGFEDIYTLDPTKPTIMFYQLNDIIRSYTKFDKYLAKKYEEFIIKRTSPKIEDEIERE